MTDVLELLKQADPVDVAQLRAEAPPRDALEAIVASRPPRQRRRRRRVLVPALGAGLAVLAAVALLLVTGGEGRRVDTAAAAALEELADAARAQPPTLAPGDSGFLYFRLQGDGYLAMAGEPPFKRGIRTEDDFGFLVTYRHMQEVWIGEERGRIRNRFGAVTLASRRDREAWEAAGRPKLPAASDDEFPVSQGVERLRIPTDPDELLEQLRRRAEGQDQGNVWIFTTMITDYLREWGVTPDQRAALLEAAARVPGIELLGERDDPNGRPGVGFAMVDEREHARHTLIIDRGTGELLAQLTETLPGGPIPAGATGYTVFESPVLVDSPGERPS
jgi:hypothetical protein